MRLRLQQEDNRSGTNWDNKGDSQRRSDRQQVATPDRPSSDLLWEMRKEMDELRSAIKGKRTETWIEWSRWWIHPSWRRSWNAQCRWNFACLNLNHSTNWKTLWINNIFKTTLGLQQPPNKILCHSFPTTLKEAVKEWFTKLPTSSIDNFEQLGNYFLCHFVEGQRLKRPVNHLHTIKQGEKGDFEVIREAFHSRNFRGQRSWWQGAVNNL